MNRIHAAPLLLLAAFLSLDLAPFASAQENDEPIQGPLELSATDHSPMAEHLRHAVTVRNALKTKVGFVTPLPPTPSGSPEDFATWKKLAAESADAYIAAVRETDFTSPNPIYLHDPPQPELGSWMLAAWTGKEKELHRALADQLEKCPPHAASFSTATLISHCAENTAWIADADTLRRLIQGLLKRQPHLLRYWDWSRLVTSADLLGMANEATALAQAIVLAPQAEVSPEFHVPAHQLVWGEVPPERMRLMADAPLLVCGLRDHADEFMDRLTKAASEFPKDHALRLFWIKARAWRGALQADDLKLIMNWNPMEIWLCRAQLLSLGRSAPPASFLDPLLIRSFDDLDKPREDYVSFSLQEQRVVERQWTHRQSPKIQQYLAKVIPTLMDKFAPKDGNRCPSDTLQILFKMAHGIDSAPLQEQIAQRWIDNFALVTANVRQENPEISAGIMAEAALLAPPALAVRMANVAAESLIEATHRVGQGAYMPTVPGTRAVFRSLLTTGQHGNFGWLCALLEEHPGKKPAKEPLPLEVQGEMAEMRSLQGVLLQRRDFIPGARAWVRNAKSGGDRTEIVWELAAPVHAPAEMTRDKMMGTPGVNFDVWGEGYGLRSPLLESLSGDYDLRFEAGTTADNLHLIATVPKANASGLKLLDAAPPSSGYLRVDVHDRVTGHEVIGLARPYSIEPPIASSGPEPNGPCGAPFLASESPTGGPPQDLHALKFLPINTDQPCLLNIWNPRPMLADGTSEEGPPLNPVCIAFATGDDVSKIVAFLPISDYAANGSDPNADDGPSSPLQFQVFTPAGLVAWQQSLPKDAPVKDSVRYVTVLFSSNGKNARTPLFQLRPFSAARSK